MYRYRVYPKKSVRSNTNSSKPMAPIQTWDSETVWSAVAYAHRINGGFLKSPVFEGDKVVKSANKDIVHMVLADTSLITDADRKMGNGAHVYLAQNLTLKTLRDSLSEFDKILSSVISKTEYTSRDRYDIAVLSSQIKAYETYKKDQSIRDRIDLSKGYLADLNEKVSVVVEVTKSVYSQNYNVYFISGITDTNQAVFFSYRESQEVGNCINVRGNVKAHRDGVTQLNRVRLG